MGSLMPKRYLQICDAHEVIDFNYVTLRTDARKLPSAGTGSDRSCSKYAIATGTYGPVIPMPRFVASPCHLFFCKDCK